MRKPPISSWFLLALIPLYFLLLETYPGFLGLMARLSDLPPRLQLVLPMHLPAQTPYTLYGSVTDPLNQRPQQVNMRLSLSSPASEDAYVLPVKSQKNGAWKLDLPELAPGPWKLKWTTESGRLLLPESLLRVENTLAAHIRPDRPVAQPGETLVVEVALNQKQQLWAQIPLELRLVGGRRVVLRQPIKTNALGQASTSLQIPSQSLPGTYHLELHLPRRPLAQVPLLIQTPSPAVAGSDLNLQALMPQLLKGQDQTLLLRFYDRQGDAVKGGWLRYQGKPVPVKGSYAQLALKAQDIQSELEFTAGDAQGHLQKISLPLALLRKGISLQPQLNAQGELAPVWQVYSPTPDLLTYAWGQGAQVMGQGQLILKKGVQSLSLPPAKDFDQHWLLLLLASEPQPRWLTFSGRGTAFPFHLSASTPDALSPVTLNLPATAPGLAPPAFPVTVSVLQTALGPTFPEGWVPALPRPFLLPAVSVASSAPLLYVGSVLFYLGLGLLAFFPLWALFQLLWQMREQQPTVPFPSQERVRRLKRALLVAQAVSLVLLLALLVSWLHGLGLLPLGSAWPSALCHGALLLLWGTLLWSLAPEWAKIHPNGAFWLSLWGPLQILLGISLSIYQPVLLPGLWLAQALGAWGVAQMLRNCFFPAAPRREDLRQGWLLSGLVVLSLLHPLVVLARGGIYFEGLEPEFAQLPQLVAEQALPIPQRQPLQYTQKSFAQWPAQLSLPATFQRGPQRWQMVLRDSQGQSLRWEQPVTVRPAVIPQLYAPKYALPGDQLQLALDFHNQTAVPQEIGYRFAGGSEQKISLNAGEKRRIWQPFEAYYAGKYPLSLEQSWQGRSVRREQEIYVLDTDYRQSHSKLQWSLEAPAHEGLVPGEEVPVLVKLTHSHTAPQRLGLQLGIPSGYLPVLDSLQNNRWLESIQQAPGYINLQTRPLPPGEELSFHYRMRSQYPGRVKMPPAQVFFMEQPQARLIETETPVFETRKK